MSDRNLYDGSCEIVAALNLLSGRWKLPILWKLSYGNMRYNELKRQVHGITNIMLTRSLQELEAPFSFFVVALSRFRSKLHQDNFWTIIEAEWYNAVSNASADNHIGVGIRI